MDVERASGAHYAAFISYSHKDAAFGRWLHRRLEGYRLPRRLAGGQGERGLVPARLSPIFRDREELPAAGDLSERVRAALQISGSLIVVCSPNAAASPWVAKEIETFRALHPDRPVLAAILEGEPCDCFPRVIRGADEAIEPLAADFRRDADGRRLGLLKLVAGVAGVGLDQLVQRDAQRRIRRVTAVTLAALVAMLVTAALAIVAINARAEAQRQRAEAEGLVEFMLTDLRQKLKGVGRLDAMTAVNERALAYYRKQDISELPADSLMRRVRTLHAMGEDDHSLRRTRQALAHFSEAERISALVLTEQPLSPQRIYVHAQSEHWLGYSAYRNKDWTKSRLYWSRYRDLTFQLVTLEPTKVDWQRETAFANGNLCTLELDSHSSARSALAYCQVALRQMVKVQRRTPKDRQSTLDVVNRLAWLADAYLANGDVRSATNARLKQIALMSPIASKYPEDASVQDQWMRTLMVMSEFQKQRGHNNEYHIYNNQAKKVAETLATRDPTNMAWKMWKRRIERTR